MSNIVKIDRKEYERVFSSIYPSHSVVKHLVKKARKINQILILSNGLSDGGINPTLDSSIEEIDSRLLELLKIYFKEGT